jgi:hypothetical protein
MCKNNHCKITVMPIYNSDIPKSSSEKVKFNLTFKCIDSFGFWHLFKFSVFWFSKPLVHLWDLFDFFYVLFFYNPRISKVNSESTADSIDLSQPQPKPGDRKLTVFLFFILFQSLCLCEFQAIEIICIRFSSIFLVDGRN